MSIFSDSGMFRGRPCRCYFVHGFADSAPKIVTLMVLVEAK